MVCKTRSMFRVAMRLLGRTLCLMYVTGLFASNLIKSRQCCVGAGA